MRSRWGFLASLVAVFACTSLVAAAPIASAADATSTTFPITPFTQVPCALGGAGEDVILNGFAHAVLRQDTDAAGGTHVTGRVSYSNVVGTGLTSGTTYRMVLSQGGTSYNFDPFVGPPYLLSATEMVRVIGAGSANDWIVKLTSHITINAVGEVTAHQEKFEVICK